MGITDRRSSRRLGLLALALLAIASGCYAQQQQQIEEAPVSGNKAVRLHADRVGAHQQLPCGATQLYSVHGLQPTKVYDVKISYAATSPMRFDMHLLRQPSAASLPELRSVRRRLNTEKLRLHPVLEDQDLVYRLDQEATDKASLTVDLVLRVTAEGVSVQQKTTAIQRTCEFDIVVEEMLFGGAFPFDTLVLIAWLVLLLIAAWRVVYPFLERTLTLVDAEDATEVPKKSTKTDNHKHS